MDGILPLWKERGMTSHDCVFKLRKILQMKKIGHGGTLDPDVDGVLPICLGKGTKIIEYLSDSGKVYCGEITLGTATETEDASGKVVARKDVRAPLSDEQIDLAMTHFLGEIKQIPPMYSAVKVAGKRLYEYARAGETVERPERSADIANYRRTSESVWNQELGTQTWKFEVACSKGTYVRTLAVDTGKYLGYPAHMSDLTRLSAASISATQCLTLEEVQNKMEAGTLDTCIIPIEKAIPFFQQIVVHTNIYQKVKNGMSLAVESLHLDTMKPLSDEPIAIFYKGKLVSLYKKHPEKNSVLKPIKVLRNDL